MTLEDIYENVKNPLNDEVLQEIYDNYQKIPTFELVVGKKTTNKSYDILERDYYNKFLFSIWKNSILNLSLERIEELEKRNSYKDIRRIREFLKQDNTNLDTTYDIANFLVNNSLDKAYFCDVKNLINHRYIHTMSGKIDLKKDDDFFVDHRLYVNIDNEDIYLLAHKFVEKCREKDIPFYFKFKDSDNRQDNFVIYSDTKNLIKYMECLDEVFSQNKNISNTSNSSLMFTGKINENYSIGDEPFQKSEKLASFNGIRSKSIDNAMKKTIKYWLYKNQYRKVSRKIDGQEKIMDFKEYVASNIVKLLSEDMFYQKDEYKIYHTLKKSAFIGRNKEELTKSIASEIDKYINNKDMSLIKVYEADDLDPSRFESEETKEIFEKKLETMKYKVKEQLGVVSTDIIEKYINTTLTDKILHKFDNCKDVFELFLKEEFKNNYIDIEKPCFNVWTKEKFKEKVEKHI